MEQVFVRNLSCVLGITSRPTGCSRVYSAFIFIVVTSSCMHILYTSGLEPLLNPCTSDASLSIAYMFDLIARIARVVSYIIMHILTYKHADRFDHIYKKLQASKQRLCGNPCTNSKEAFHFAMAFALIRLLATLTPTFSRYNSQLQSTWMDIPFHLKFIFNFYMELQLFVFCSMLELCFNSIRVRLSRLRKYAPINSLSQCGMVLVDRWGLPKHPTSIVVVHLNMATYSETVRTLRRAHAGLCDLASKINSLFGVRLLVDITAQLLALLLRLKIVIIWIFHVIKGAANPHRNTFLEDGAEMERALAALVLCPIHIGTVYSVVFYCTRTVKKNEQLVSEIYRLLNHSLNSNDREELMIFASQLAHRKVQFTAAGVMPLDFTLLYSFIGVVTTYLVILTQIGVSLSRYSMDVSSFDEISRKNNTVMELPKCNNTI